MFRLRIMESQKTDITTRKRELVPSLSIEGPEAGMLVDEMPDLQRCKRCILPHTFPYISFDADGVCNYCNNYIVRNEPKPIEELDALLEPYRRNGQPDCIIPFSGVVGTVVTRYISLLRSLACVR